MPVCKTSIRARNSLSDAGRWIIRHLPFARQHIVNLKASNKVFEFNTSIVGGEVSIDTGI
jgi:hypothetical protein